MYLSYPPKSYRWMLPASIQWKLDSVGERRVAISFDDGPDPETTPAVLEILDEFDVRASFFCLGRNAEKYPALVQELLDRGHRVGNHGYNHLDGWRTGSRHYYRDILHCGQVMPSGMFRPPYGRIRPNQAKALSKRFRLVMWSLLSRDFDRHYSPRQCLDLLRKNTGAGDIIVFHDSRQSAGRMLPILPTYLDFLKNASYLFDFCG